MPNCHWYGTLDDHKAVLSQIMAAGEVEVYKLYSEPGESLRALSTVDDILAGFDMPHPNGAPRAAVHLNLWVKGSGPAPEIERIPVDPRRNHGAPEKERTGVMGFVSFYLERPMDGMLRHSQTNTVSESRMGAENGIVRGLRGELWDVRLTNRISARINRLIRKQAEAKIGAASVLPGAARFWEGGGNFDGHYSKTQNASYYRPIS